MKMNAFKTMRIISVLGLALLVGMALAAAPAQAQAQAQDSPKVACAEWCKANPDKCVKCSPMVGCGAGYKKIKSFKGKGKNYYACAKIKNPNLAACKKWCAENKGCVKCSSKVGCGKGYKKIKSFKGKGKNYYACAKLKHDNKVECEKWCKAHPDQCAKCSPSVGCGAGYKKIKSFGGKGKNYYACAKLKHDNKAACAKWCKAHPDQCAKCSPTVGCGPGYKKIKSFKGKGKDWYACQKR